MQQEEHRPYTIQPDGSGMVEMSSVRELRPKVGDSEKITINLGYVDLGQVDLLVQEGFYSNRTDFIRTAIRNQLDRYNDAVKRIRRTPSARSRSSALRQERPGSVEAAGEMLHIQVLGLASIADDVPPELAMRTIGSTAQDHAEPDVRTG